VTAKNRRSLGKVRRESATTTSAVLKIRSKSSALFFCKSSCFYKVLDLGRKKRQKSTTTSTQSALLFTTFVPSPFTCSEKHLKEEGIKDF